MKIDKRVFKFIFLLWLPVVVASAFGVVSCNRNFEFKSSINETGFRKQTNNCITKNLIRNNITNSYNSICSNANIF